MSVLLSPVEPAPVEDARRTSHSGKLGVLDGLAVLLVDDEPGVRSLMARTLEQMGCAVLSLGDPLAATDVRVADFDVALLDVVMPQMTGPTLAESLQRRGPLPVVYMSGYPSVGALGEMLGVEPLLRKPFTRDELGAALTRAYLDGRESPFESF